MSKLDPLHGRLYPTFSLWDVRDVEAHARTTLETALRAHNDARLKPPLKAKFLSSLVVLCWRLSGLEEDGRTLRYEHQAEILVVGDRDRATVTVGPFGTVAAAEGAVARWRDENPSIFSFVGYRSERPKGAYDPERGISFSTYSRGIMTLRVVDSFRDELGDSRYKRPQLLSLDQLLDDHEGDTSSSMLEMRGPGSRADSIDELNRHAYYDPFADIDTTTTLGWRSDSDELPELTGGYERVAATG